MYRNYSLGFLYGFVLLSFILLGVYFNISDNDKIESTQTQGEAVKEDVYYLVERNGYVLVCESDKTTIYEYTNIPLDELPDTLANEIKAGKYIEGKEALYGFLENYSS